ncbi:MAG: PAS domain-containing sensor histidine kinase [Leeuwenhoekiella sp.]
MPAKKRNRFLSLLGGSAPATPEPQQEKFYYEQIASIVGAGGGYIDFVKKKTYFDKQLQTILETPEEYTPSLKHSLHFYDMEFHDSIQKNFEGIKKGKSFEQEIKMITYTNKTLWAKIAAKPIFDSKKGVIGLRGVIINIDDEKKDGIALDRSLQLIEANNNRLFKFANYVSHNLKSHVNNLELTSQLVDETKLPEEQKELFQNFGEITKSLSRTVAQLNEVVSIQSRSSEKRVTINLQDALEQCMSSLHELITKEEAYIYSDFSEAPEVSYIPDFLDNILCTLVKNGINSKKPDRKPEIKAYSLEHNCKTSLVIEDNSAGFDVEKDNDHIFHMSKSSSFESDNKSEGLFIVKNQVEAMGGIIKVESKLGYGTKFTITL